MRSSFQSTPPRGGRRVPAACSDSARDAPFQSTPPRGGRRVRRCVDHQRRFNPRPRVGGDTLLSAPRSDAALTAAVSIHAPAWGATCRRRRSSATYGRFQSTPPRGGRRWLHVSVCAGFQSTPPRGGRPDRCSFVKAERSFNPRPRVGGDQDLHETNPRRSGGRRGRPGQVSIHAPAWGATTVSPISRARRRTRRFNPRPRVGGDPAVVLTSHELPQYGFNPRPRVGGDSWPSTNSGTSQSCSVGRQSRCFNPRPRVGGDATLPHALMQSTPPRGGTTRDRQ